MANITKRVGNTVTIKFTANNTGNTALPLTASFSVPVPIIGSINWYSDLGTVSAGATKSVTNTYLVVPPMTPAGTYTITTKLIDTNDNTVYDTKYGYFDVVQDVVKASIMSVTFNGTTALITVKNTGNVAHTFYVGATMVQTVSNDVGCAITGWGNPRDQSIISANLDPQQTQTLYLTLSSLLPDSDYLIVKVWDSYPDPYAIPTPICLDGTWI